ncbi:MAG: nicotinate-nucleotide adenylyltransferase [Gammaproteobacteria bacterium]|nr:nicotinate-nucleotide adenylyltransferase [Gammaproteobacteria bacterium]
MTNPIGILGGSFDPVHYGHLRLAMECIESVGLEKVMFVPLNIPAHREPLVATAEQRKHMLSLAISNNGRFETSDIELERNEVSYMVDTLQILRNHFPENPLCLIMGMDAFVHFDSWRQWQRIPELAHIVITNRPDSDHDISDGPLKELLQSRQTHDNAELATAPAGRIRSIDIPMLDISSSRIRNKILQKKPINYLLPDEVINYITTNKIYG